MQKMQAIQLSCKWWFEAKSHIFAWAGGCPRTLAWRAWQESVPELSTYIYNSVRCHRFIPSATLINSNSKFSQTYFAAQNQNSQVVLQSFSARLSSPFKDLSVLSVKAKEKVPFFLFLSSRRGFRVERSNFFTQLPSTYGWVYFWLPRRQCQDLALIQKA